MSQGATIDTWSPDVSRLAYTHGHSELYTVRPDGAENTRVSGMLVNNGYLSRFDWSPDGESLVYHANQDMVGVLELYSVAPDGADNIKLNSTPVSGSQGIKIYIVYDDAEIPGRTTATVKH